MWYFLVLTTLSPSDLQNTDTETLHQLIHWWLTKSQTSVRKTSYKLPHGHFTTLIFLHSNSVWYGCVRIIPSSWSWWHSASFGRKWMALALPQAVFFTYGLFGKIVRTWSDGAVQPKLLLSFCSALLSPSMMIQFLCSGWKSTAK